MRLAYYDERVIEKMVEISGVGGATTVADVGTGTGFVAAGGASRAGRVAAGGDPGGAGVGTGTGFVAAGVASRAGRVAAVDNSRAMLDVARANLDALGLPNVELIEGGGTGPPPAGRPGR